MDFGKAIEQLKAGNKVSRAGWNGKGMFIFLVCGNAWNFETDVSGVDEIETEPFMCLKTASNTLIPWNASQQDAIADDWGVV